MEVNRKAFILQKTGFINSVYMHLKKLCSEHGIQSLLDFDNIWIEDKDRN